ncbi:MAG: aldolase/citrate lyase family protein [bacterium]|uniref:HpcH/HpaI aldolase n=2 Tax=Bacteria candidate phyla TaxID=1783234 RepID=A0A124G0J5_UNCT6|nr:MAG: HpcH/HpaI aldolase [candidate division TA06 bacterium 32_111]KUK87685.1 MAG: HpcH/HpaI aldolase [candidate division TA06 bacterium 34_109]MDI6699819.1 aldolase/citrate lyase family protein [bacterium]HAF07524.1 hypothetical protein [candidate division WOR-3 bacterium]HCP17593.1 hypothetical protein [candidate division WOR-3 bacterium]
MEIRKESYCGSENPFDIHVKIEPAGNGIDIEVFSTLGEEQFKKIKELVEDILNFYGIVNAKITLKDFGAPDFVIRARMETVIRRASQEIEKKVYLEKMDLRYIPLRSIFRININNPKYLNDSFKLKPDAFLLDLYKGVSINEKDSARILVGNFLNEKLDERIFRMIKINPLDLGGNDDIDYLTQFSPDFFVLSKCETEYDVKKSLELVEKAEKKYKINRIFLIPSIESVKGLINLYEISSVSDRVFGAILNIKEYLTSLSLSSENVTDHIYFAKLEFITKVKAANIMAFETTTSKIDNPDEVKEELKLSYDLGFDGKIITHPKLIEITHSIFKPEGNIDKYENIVSLYNKAYDMGSGLVVNNSFLVDRYEIARSLKFVHLLKMDKKEQKE